MVTVVGIDMKLLLGIAGTILLVVYLIVSGRNIKRNGVPLR